MTDSPDLLGLVDPDGPVDAQVDAIRTACESLGFFRIPRTAVADEVVDAAWDAAVAFFALPEAEKQAVGFPEPGAPYGWSPLGFETLAKSVGDEAAAPDLKESFSVGPDCGPPFPDPPADQAWIRSPSLWPERPVELRVAWTAYYRALAGVAERLMALMALALDLPADHFATAIDRPITSMRALHYPAVTDPAGRSLRAGAHTDYGTLTILRTDDVPGLQIQRPDGRWADVAPDPDTFVVNLGDSIAQSTNDRWRSTMHRVVPADRPRHSFAFFHMANWDATIECLPTCRVAGEPPRHEPVQAGPWLMRKFQSTV